MSGLNTNVNRWKDEIDRVVVVEWDNRDPQVYTGGFSTLEAEAVVECIREEAEAAEVMHHLRRVTIVEEQREFARARSAARTGWDCEIESLEEFIARPNKGFRFDGSEHTRRLSSEDWKADEIKRANRRDILMGAAGEDQVDDETRSNGPVIG